MSKIVRGVECLLLAASAVIIFISTSYAGNSPGGPHYNWGGFYLGVDAGHGWGREGTPVMTLDDGSHSGAVGYFAAGGNVTPRVRQSGGIAGLQLGYNWMLSRILVAGLVTDIQKSWMNDARTNTVQPPGNWVRSEQSNSVRTDWLGTLRAKFGVAHDNWLFYATSGLAYGHVKASGVLSIPSVDFAGSVSKTKIGLAIGAGVGYGLTPSWTLGVEYLYVDLGHVSYTERSTNGVIPLTAFTVKNDLAADILTANVSYKF